MPFAHGYGGGPGPIVRMTGWIKQPTCCGGRAIMTGAASSEAWSARALFRAVAGMLAVWMLAVTPLALARQGAGPQGQSFSIETQDERYTASFQSGDRYSDSRPRSGRWTFDGRTLCLLVNNAGPRQPEYEVCMPWRDLAVGEGYDSRYWKPDGAPVRITRTQ